MSRDPPRNAFPYFGGKSLIAKQLAARLDRIPHTVYAEPFIGGGSVFFARTSRPKVEVINDLDKEIANFFRVAQRHYEALLETLRWSIRSRADLERIAGRSALQMTDIERAARTYFIQITSFGGARRDTPSFSRTANGSRGRYAFFDRARLAEHIEALHERLAGVTIECLDYRRLIDLYDSPGTLFYLDPPYFGHEAE